MSYSAVGQTALPGGTALPSELPTGQLSIPLPGGVTYTVGAAQAQQEQPKPAEPPESTIKWAQFAAATIGAIVGIATLTLMFKKGKARS